MVEVRNGEGEENWGQGRIALAGKADANEWTDLPTALADGSFDHLLPSHYKLGSPQAHTALESGHGGSDYYTTATFVAACRGELDDVVGIHEAMDMTLPGLCSQLSAARGGKWVEVPDSRLWTTSAAVEVGNAKL